MTEKLKEREIQDAIDEREDELLRREKTAKLNEIASMWLWASAGLALMAWQFGEDGSDDPLIFGCTCVCLPVAFGANWLARDKTFELDRNTVLAVLLLLWLVRPV